MNRILRLFRLAQPLAAALATPMNRPPRKLCALACLPLSVALSSCEPCTTIGCPPGLSVSIGMASGGALPAGLYQLQVSDGGFTGIGQCQLPGSAADCPDSMPSTEAAYDGQRLTFSFWGHVYPGGNHPFVILVDGATRKTGSLSVSDQTSQPNGPHCGDCVAGSATVDLP
jgi:hypothetical protein